jgi:hypothetical protein
VQVRPVDPREEKITAALALLQAGHDALRDALDCPRPLENKAPHELIMCAAGGLLWNGPRADPDALTVDGEECELKAWDVRSGRRPQWASSRDFTRTVLERYRATAWFVFAVFDGLDLLALYRVAGPDMEGAFIRFEAALERYEQAVGTRPNNPKFTWLDVRPRAEVLLSARDGFIEPVF